MSEPDAPRPVPVPESDEDLLAECRVETFRAGGPGGQHQNTTESGVRLVHLATGIRVTAREERSQHRNRAKALERLRERLAQHNRVEKPRKATRVPWSQKEKRLEEKKQRGHKKRLRRPPETD
jgi:protein subunit release factor A